MSECPGSRTCPGCVTCDPIDPPYRRQDRVPTVSKPDPWAERTDR